MAESTLQNELLGLEKKFWQAIKDDDFETAVSLTDDPCILTGAQGVSKINKDTFLQIMKGANYTLKQFDLKDPEVQRIADNVAVLAYNVHEKLLVDGKEVELDAAESSVWVKKNGSWVCSHHTESLLGDPFGRDRKH